MEIKTENIKLEDNSSSQKVSKFQVGLDSINASLKEFISNSKSSDNLEKLKREIREDPKNASAHFEVGSFHYNQGDLQGSLEYLNKAMILDPSNRMQKAVNMRQKALAIMNALRDAKDKYASNKIDKAFRTLSAAVHLELNSVNVREKILGTRRELVKDLIKRLEEEVKSDVKDHFTKQHAKSTRNVKGEQVKKLFNVNEQMSYLKGLSFYNQGLMKEAIPLLTEAVQQNSNVKAKELLEKSKALDFLIESSAEKASAKQYLESIDLLTKALEVDKNNHRINQAIYFQRSLANFSLMNTSKAVADFRSFEDLQKK